MTRIDVHQHLWTEPLIAALAARSEAPRLRRDGDGTWLLDLAGEPTCALDVAAERVDLRAAQVRDDGLDRALICISSPVGLEALPPDESRGLVGAHLAGALALGEPFGVWGALALADAEPVDVDDLLRRGCVGLSLPAGALATPAGLDRVGPLLERLERADAPLLVHPGPAPWRPGDPAEPGAPGWWPAMTRYVADTSAAWHAWAHRGRAEHPTLRVVFAMLAGGAPLHVERLRARGGPAEAVGDERVFYDTSSYGAHAVELLASVVGDRQLVYGSDRPVVDPGGWCAGPLRGRRRALISDNPARLLGAAGVHA